VETDVAPKGPLQCKGCQRFGHTQRYCGYAPRCVVCGEAHISVECSTSQRQLKCCSCGANHTANYRGCAKWKEARTALTKRAPTDRSKVGGTPSPPSAPKAKQAVPSAEQQGLGSGWNHVIRGGRIVKAATPTSPNPPLAESPARTKVATNKTKGVTTKSAPKVTTGHKQASSTKQKKPVKPAQASQPKPKKWWLPDPSSHPPRKSLIS
jgi:hypothetical protein